MTVLLEIYLNKGVPLLHCHWSNNQLISWWLVIDQSDSGLSLSGMGVNHFLKVCYKCGEFQYVLYSHFDWSTSNHHEIMKGNFMWLITRCTVCSYVLKTLDCQPFASNYSFDSFSSVSFWFGSKIRSSKMHTKTRFQLQCHQQKKIEL